MTCSSPDMSKAPLKVERGDRHELEVLTTVSETVSTVPEAVTSAQEYSL